MSRYVLPQAFALYSAKVEKAPAQRVPQQAASTLAFALRWVTTPLLGFPRSPFRVYRRAVNASPPQENNSPINLAVDGVALAEWGRRERYVVSFSVTPEAGSSLTVEALDVRHKVIPGGRRNFTGPASDLLSAPGIAALRIWGKGKVTVDNAIDQHRAANKDTDWVLIEQVGLPFATNEIAATAYAQIPQGPIPASLNGLDAARARLIVALAYQQQPPRPIQTDIQVQNWPLPLPDDYLKFLRPSSDPSKHSMLGLIKDCLLNTDDTDPAKLQIDYPVQELNLGGYGPVDGSSPSSGTTKMKNLPLLPVTMLAVSSDCLAATALGYGTIAVVQHNPPAPQPTAYDFMVTADFVLPNFGKIELAALAQPRPDPESPATLTVAKLRRNRPPARDAAENETVQLKWDFASYPQSYAILVSPEPNKSGWLNAPRPFAGGGYELYTPARPADVEGNAPAALATFTNPVSPVPLTGSRTSRYLVFAQDVFGRWAKESPLAFYTASAPPVQQPNLHSVVIEPTGASATGTLVPSRIEIEFSWDWSDRSLYQVEFFSKFFPADQKPGDVPANFAMSNGWVSTSTIVVQFEQSGQITLKGASGKVELLPPSSTDEQRKYRLTIEGLSCIFTSATELAYAVWARAYEKVRLNSATPTPTEWSAIVGPRIAHTYNPLPPAAPTLTTELRWTALPDATGRARGVLTWPPIAGAAGYVVWEATETALRDALDPTLPKPDPPPGLSLSKRADQLRQMLNANATAYQRSLIAFTRLNPRLIPDTRFEVELPGGASTLYVYRVSAIGASNLESDRSKNVAFFAVPRRNQPGQPRLWLRNAKGAISVIAVPGAGATPAGFNGYRVRNTALLDDVGLKGPPKIQSGDSRWKKVVLDDFTDKDKHANALKQARADGVAEGWCSHYYRVEDAVAESWYPYYYQIVAVGVDKPSEGEYAGESLPSANAQGFLPPLQPPSLKLVSNVFTNRGRVLTFRTNLPVKRTALGVATIEVLRIIKLPGDGTGFEWESLLPAKRVDAHDVPEGPAFILTVVPVNTKEINRRPPDNKGEGEAEYTVRLPHIPGLKGIIKVTDPLGRAVEIEF